MFTDDISFYYPPHFFLHGKTARQAMNSRISCQGVGMTLDYHLVDFLHLSLRQQRTKDQQEPMYVSDSFFPSPFPFLAFTFYVLIHGISFVMRGITEEPKK